MRFSFNWLKKYLDTNLNLWEISEKLTSLGLEVEKVEDPEIVFQNFKIVRIENISKHPNADRLNICTVIDADNNSYSIVCGASNVRVGLCGILALPGAIIPSFGTALTGTKIRGVDSEGMLCSAGEMMLSIYQGDGIIDFGNINLCSSLGDLLGYDGGIIDVSITPNRGDCFSVKGIARDLAASSAGKFIESKEMQCNSAFEFPISINHEKSDSYYKYAPVIAFRVMRGVKNSESPDWLKQMLNIAGIKSHSLLVDLSNFHMVDSGRPIHIYDLNKINGDFNVRFAKKFEKFVDLKLNEYTLQVDMLISADDKNPLCLMGITGGDKSACDMNTTDILIESALYDPVFISKTATFLNITTDSRTRFERGIDRDSCINGIEEMTKLILNNAGGSVSDIKIIGQHLNETSNIFLRKNKLNSIAGADIPWEKVESSLLSIGLKKISSSEDGADFLIPGWRSDLILEEDLVEEVLRIVGYDQIPARELKLSVQNNDTLLSKQHNMTGIRRLLASLGLSEIISYSFIKNEHADFFKKDHRLLHVLNPISNDMSVMRPSILPGLLSAAERSLKYNQSHVELFEIGSVFWDFEKHHTHIGAIRTGPMSDRSWFEKERIADVFDIKGDVLDVLSYLEIKPETITIENNAPSYYHPFRSGRLQSGKKHLGYFGELHPRVNQLFGINEKIVAFELCTKGIVKKVKDFKYNSKIFPVITRDFAFIFDKTLMVGNLINEIIKLDKRISKVDIFDVFDISKEKKSIGFSVILSADDRTLTEQEASDVSGKIVKYISNCGGELRGK